MAVKIAVHPALLLMTPVNNLFVSFAESTDNFVSSKSALPFALKLVYSEPLGNHGIQIVLCPRPPSPQAPGRPARRSDRERGLQSGNVLQAHLLGSRSCLSVPRAFPRPDRVVGLPAWMEGVGAGTPGLAHARWRDLVHLSCS